jgi:tetratricopeptide (TPR) repeat protein
MAVALLGGGCSGGALHEPGDPVAAGWEWFRSGEFGLAEKAFARAEQAAGTDVPKRVEALYGQAVTWHLRRPGENAARAAELYREVMTTAPTHDLAGWSALGLARLPESFPPGKEPPRDERLRGYQAVVDGFPNHPAAEESFLMQQGLRLAEPASEAEPHAVLAQLDAYRAAHTNSPNIVTLWSLTEQAATWLGLPDRRLEAIFQQWRTASVDPANTNAVSDLSLTYWRIATLAEFEVGDFELAREYYGKLIDKYPTQQRVFLAKQELQRMAELEARLGREGSP